MSDDTPLAESEIETDRLPWCIVVPIEDKDTGQEYSDPDIVGPFATYAEACYGLDADVGHHGVRSISPYRFFPSHDMRGYWPAQPAAKAPAAPPAGSPARSVAKPLPAGLLCSRPPLLRRLLRLPTSSIKFSGGSQLPLHYQRLAVRLQIRS
jgi:hypothetical protein